MNLKLFSYLIVALLVLSFNLETNGQIQIVQASNDSTSASSSNAFINVSDSTINNSEYIDVIDKYSIYYINTNSDEGTNDPTQSGMHLEYWYGRYVYRKTTSLNGVSVLDIIYVPKED